MSAQLKEEIAIVIEHGAGQGVGVCKGVIVLPGTLERVDLLNKFIEVHFRRERFTQHVHGVPESGRATFRELRLGEDGVMRAEGVDFDSAPDGLDCDMSGPTDGGASPVSEVQLSPLWVWK